MSLNSINYEQLKALALEAGYLSDMFGRGHWDEPEFQKFAELIVKECMRMCDVAAVGYETHGHNNIASGCDSAKEYIAEHFGVEE